jgi:D-lactate dehydrogenase
MMPIGGAGTAIAVFDAKSYDQRFLDKANARFDHHMTYFEARLEQSTVSLAVGFPAICVFVNDRLDEAVLTKLSAQGTRVVALRCAGYNNVDLAAATKLGITIVRVPAYSPHAVAEFTIGLMLALDRHIHRAWARVRENNFALDGLIGRNFFGRTVGVIGTGRIGMLVARIFKLGFGCDVLACDLAPSADLVATGIRYVERQELIAQADIITLHCPLTPDTRQIINAAAIAAAKPGVMIINTSRGALIDTQALIDGLKSHKIGSVALDVYEQEADLFFKDLSSEIIVDDVFQRLLTFPNVLVTGHQAFLTEEALTAIAETTLQSIADAVAGRQLNFQIGAESESASEASTHV